MLFRAKRVEVVGPEIGFVIMENVTSGSGKAPPNSTLYFDKHAKDKTIELFGVIVATNWSIWHIIKAFDPI